MIRILQTIVGSMHVRIAIMMAIALVSLLPSSVSAFSFSTQGGANAARGSDQPVDLFGDAGIFSTITEVLLFILGAISVIMIIIGGLRYVISGGDSKAITAAKNTILYAIIGLVVAVLAYAIIDFVLMSIMPGGAGGGTGSGAV